jgi:hypothetical protein
VVAGGDIAVRTHAERRFGDAALASELLEARHVAVAQGAQLLVDRLAAEGD